MNLLSSDHTWLIPVPQAVGIHPNLPNVEPGLSWQSTPLAHLSGSEKFQQVYPIEQVMSHRFRGFVVNVKWHRMQPRNGLRGLIHHKLPNHLDVQLHLGQDYSLTFVALLLVASSYMKECFLLVHVQYVARVPALFLLFPYLSRT